MKYIITNKQYKLLKEDEQEILDIPSVDLFGGWDGLQEYLKRKGNPPYSIGGDLDLVRNRIESLGNLQSVGGYLNLVGTPIESLGNLISVGGYLDLRETPIQSLGNLQLVSGGLFLSHTPISKKMTTKQIREKVNVRGIIYLQ